MSSATLEKPQPALPEQYLFLEDVQWDTYKTLLAATHDRRLQITYDQGRLEIMSPLPRHERIKSLLGTLVQLMAMEQRIAIDALGSTTFYRQMLEKGLEPDECFYIQNYKKVWGKDDLDLEVDPPPDLVIEVENTTRVIKRLPIYAALGVPEVWRHDGLKLIGLKLANGLYEPIESSLAFPFLKVRELNRFVDRARVVPNDQLLNEFRDWVRTLA